MRGRSLFLVLAVLGAVLFWPRESLVMDVHGELQQRLLEAEFGSATTFHFAAGSKVLVPSSEPFGDLLYKLQSMFPKVRWEAAQQLASKRDPRAVDAVIRAMHDPDGTIRICVMASALGRLKDPRALGALTEAMFDRSNRDLRLCAIQSLGMIKDPAAVPKLIEALETRNTPVAAANAIARIGDDRGVEPIIRMAADPGLRLWMVSALGELGSVKAREYLLQVGQDDKKVIRKAAAEAQWKIDRLSADDPLRALMETIQDEPSQARRMWAAFRLGESGESRALPALINALSDEHKGVRGRAAAALVRIGKPVLPKLRELLNDEDPVTQSYAVAMLAYLGNEADIPRLEQVALQGGDKLARTAEISVQYIRQFMAAESPAETVFISI